VANRDAQTLQETVLWSRPSVTHYSKHSSSNVQFYTENSRFEFLSALWGRLRDNVRCSPWAHWKARGGLPINVKWTFLLGVTAEVLRANVDLKAAISLQWGQFDQKFQVEGVESTNHSSCHKTRVNGLSCGIRTWAQVSCVLLQITRLIDRQSDRETDSFLVASHKNTVCLSVSNACSPVIKWDQYWNKQASRRKF